MKTFRFDATIESGKGGGAFVRFPFDVQEHFGTRGQVKIVASFDREKYRGSLAPMGGGCHILGIRKDIRAAIGKDIGDRVQVVVELDSEERTVKVPRDLAAALRQRGLGERFEALSYTRRREAVELVQGAMRDETRQRRIEKIVGELEQSGPRGAAARPAYRHLKK